MKLVTIYSKDYCPYCKAAKNLLSSKGVEFVEIDMMKLDSEEIAKVDKKTNGFRTVPKIFIGDEFIGGFDDLSALNSSGELDRKLNE